MKRSLRIVSMLVGALLVLLFASIAFAQDAGVAPSIAVTTNVTNTAPAQLPAAAVTVAQLVLSLLGFALWEAWLGATKKFAPNSTVAIVIWVVSAVKDAVVQAAKRPPGPMAPALILLLLAASGCSPAYVTTAASATAMETAIGGYHVYTHAARRKITASCPMGVAGTQCRIDALAPFETKQVPILACIEAAAPVCDAAEAALKARDVKAAEALLPSFVGPVAACAAAIHAEVSK